MPVLDPFINSNAFSTTTLTDAINKVPFIPGKVGQSGMFSHQGIRTRNIMIEEKNGELILVPTTPYGAPAVKNKALKRKVRTLSAVHIALEDEIEASEIQDLRPFGSETGLQSLQDYIMQRMMEMRDQRIELTREHLMLGALKGVVYDADMNTVLYNLFTEFGVVQHDEIDFSLDDASPTAGAVRLKCHDIKRKIEDELGSVVYDHIHCFCGSTFMDQLVSHNEVKDAYDRWNNGEQRRRGYARGQFEIYDIVFEEYRGQVGSTKFVGDGEARFFPVGVPGLFKMYYAPADFMEAVNTLGLPLYAKQYIDRDLQRWVAVHLQFNPLPICTRPRVLIKAKNT